MPLLGSLITGLFAWFAAFFGQWLTKKAAFAAAAIAAFAVLTVALFVLVGASIATLAVSLPAGSVWQIGLYCSVPDNAPAVVSVVLAFDAALALYRWNVENLRLAAYVT